MCTGINYISLPGVHIMVFARMATKPKFLVPKNKLLVTLANVPVAISSPVSAINMNHIVLFWFG